MGILLRERSHIVRWWSVDLGPELALQSSNPVRPTIHTFHSTIVQNAHRTLTITPSREGSTAKVKSLGFERPRNASLKKKPKKCPSAAPASTSEGKCAFASTRAQPVAAVTENKPNRSAIRPPSSSGRESRFREASDAYTEVLEVRDEGKLLLFVPLGRVRFETSFKPLVARSVDSTAATPTASPLTLEYAQSPGLSPLGVASMVTIYAPLIASLNK